MMKGLEILDRSVPMCAKCKYWEPNLVKLDTQYPDNTFFFPVENDGATSTDNPTYLCNYVYSQCRWQPATVATTQWYEACGQFCEDFSFESRLDPILRKKNAESGMYEPIVVA